MKLSLITSVLLMVVNGSIFAADDTNSNPPAPTKADSAKKTDDAALAALSNLKSDEAKKLAKEVAAQEASDQALLAHIKKSREDQAKTDEEDQKLQAQRDELNKENAELDKKAKELKKPAQEKDASKEDGKKDSDKDTKGTDDKKE